MVIEVFAPSASWTVVFEATTKAVAPPGDDLPSLGYAAGLAPAIPVVTVASSGSTCSRLLTVRCSEPRSTGRAIGGQEMTVAVPGENWNHFVVSGGRERRRGA